MSVGKFCYVFCSAVVFGTLFSNAQESEEETSPQKTEDIQIVNRDAPGDDVLVKYDAPDTSGLHWAETFDGDVSLRWKASKKEKYNGVMEATLRRQEAIVGDVGLLVTEPAKHYAYSTSFKPLVNKAGVPFILQYEVKFQDGLQCGGAYLKLFDAAGRSGDEFDQDTHYVVMFGPDRCGATNKVHFILQHKSPKTGKWEEKHFKEPPPVPLDQQSHLYTLVINPDNSFEIQIDRQKKASGNLLESMSPPVNPPKQIDDPSDSKPQDWVDQDKIDDPESVKPGDWDEDEPRKIKDPAAFMPDGWVEDAQKRIPDPDAKIPQDWDEEEDGEWDAPIIDNPVCSVGCEKWVAPEIANPKYKGKWVAPLIDNPAYKGEWKPQQILNPDHFVDETPSLLPQVDSVGFDIWTMQGGILFDNIVVGNSLDHVTSFTENTYTLRNKIEDNLLAAATGSKGIFGMLSDNIVAVAVTFVIVAISLIWFCCLRDAVSSAPPRAKKDGATSDEKATKTGGSKAPKDSKKNDDTSNGEHQNSDGKASGGASDVDVDGK